MHRSGSVNGVDVGTGDNLNHVLQHFFNANKPLIIGFAEVKEVDKKNEIISQQAKEEYLPLHYQHSIYLLYINV